MTKDDDTRLIAWAGCYADGPAEGPGGIVVLSVNRDGTDLRMNGRTDCPEQAGYLVYSPSRSTLYAVDERKNDGRGPTGPAASVYAFSIDQTNGTLTELNRQISPGPFPTYLSIHEEGAKLVSANHGSFDHVEHVVKTAEGWTTEFRYDDSTVVLYDIDRIGRIDGISDVRVFADGGVDPNSSRQASGHGQASGHAHCAVIDPTGKFVVVCDKAADRITTFGLSETFKEISHLQLPPETGPRHLVFSPGGKHAWATCEFSSTVVSLSFDASSGEFGLLGEVVATAADGPQGNEPADIRCHPNGRILYVNNRGEDTLAWFDIGSRGQLVRAGATKLATSDHPGVAARSFALSPGGEILLLADRPANLIRSYRIDADSGAVEQVDAFPVADPAFVTVANLGQ